VVAGLLGAACVVHVSDGFAQRGKPARLGYLSGSGPGARDRSIEVLKIALVPLGWRVGETLVIEERWAEGDFTRLTHLARELVALRPDVIVSTGALETGSLQAITRELPIIFMQVADPLVLGLVASIARPGGNVTGFTQGPQHLWRKRLELLTELLGRAVRAVAWVGNPGNPGSKADWLDARDAAAMAGAEIVRVEASRTDTLIGAVAALRDVDALLVQWDFLFSTLAEPLAELAARKGLPTAYGNRGHVLAGGLMSYGGDLRENYRQGAGYVDRVLRGTAPADLPVNEVSRYELVVNLGAVKRLGIDVPVSLLSRIDEIIE
jgi:putative ABC transport system substrate-binding protein